MPIYNKFIFSNPISKIYAFNNAEFIDAIKKIENNKALFLEEHLEIMKNSAKHFGFAFDKAKIKIDI